MDRSKLLRVVALAAVLGTLLAGLIATVPVLAAPPTNDTSAGAASIGSLPVDLTTDMVEATADAGDPARCQGDPTGMVSVWFRLELADPSNRWVEFLAVSVDATATRVRVLDAPGGAPVTSCNTNDAWFIAQPGHTYWVVEEALVPTGSSGPIDVILRGRLATGAPPNDRASQATVVSAFPFADTVDMAGSTHSSNDPRNCRGSEQGVSNAQTIWYQLAPSTHRRRVGIKVLGPFYNGFWVVRSPGGHVITCVDNPTGDGAVGAFRAEPGRTYWIVVGKGDTEHSVSEPTTIRIHAAQAGFEDPANSGLPSTSTTGSSTSALGSASSGGPILPMLPLLAGALGLILALRRQRPRVQ